MVKTAPSSKPVPLIVTVCVDGLTREYRVRWSYTVIDTTVVRHSRVGYCRIAECAGRPRRRDEDRVGTGRRTAPGNRELERGARVAQNVEPAERRVQPNR